MLLGLLFIPALIVVIGVFWRQKPPARINWFYGYRTWYSMKSQATWDFAHRYLAELWFKLGLVLAVVAAGYYLVISGFSVRAVEYMVGRMLLVQLALIVIPVVMTEIALRQNFDRNGNPR